MNELERAFYDSINRSCRHFEKAYREHILDPTTDHPYADETLHQAFVTLNAGLSTAEVEAAIYVARQLAVGVVHSLLATIDGASYLTGEGKQLELVNTETIEPLTDSTLHERFMYYLAEIGEP